MRKDFSSGSIPITIYIYVPGYLPHNPITLSFLSLYLKIKHYSVSYYIIIRIYFQVTV